MNPLDKKANETIKASKKYLTYLPGSFF